jgi:hypothetical protein
VGTILGLGNKRLVLALAILALAAGGAVLAGGVLASSEPQVPPAPVSNAVSAQLTDHFAVLGAPTTDVPAAIQDVNVGLNEKFGLNAGLAREVAYGPSAPAIWVIPGSQGMCIHVMTEVPQGGCTSVENALAGNLQIEVGGTTVYGVAPDGNSELLVHDTDGSTERVPVHQNVYVINKAGAQTLDLNNGAGQAVTVNVKE